MAPHLCTWHLQDASNSSIALFHSNRSRQIDMWALCALLVILHHAAAASVSLIFDAFGLGFTYWPDFGDPALPAVAGSTNLPSQGGREVRWAYGTYSASSTTPPYVWYDFYGTGIEFFGYWGEIGSGPLAPGGAGALNSTLTLGDGQAAYGTSSGSRTGTAMANLPPPFSLAKFTGQAPGLYRASLVLAEGGMTITGVAVELEIGGR